jgi:hypothetical protein
VAVAVGFAAHGKRGVGAYDAAGGWLAGHSALRLTTLGEYVPSPRSTLPFHLFFPLLVYPVAIFDHV